MFLKAGMNDFLLKPLDHKEIERVLRDWLPKEKWSNVCTSFGINEVEQ